MATCGHHANDFIIGGLTFVMDGKILIGAVIVVLLGVTFLVQIIMEEI